MAAVQLHPRRPCPPAIWFTPTVTVWAWGLGLEFAETSIHNCLTRRWVWQCPDCDAEHDVEHDASSRPSSGSHASLSRCVREARHGGGTSFSPVDMLVYDDSDGEDEDDEGHDDLAADELTPMLMTEAICETH
jgi:hypothetical protein